MIGKMRPTDPPDPEVRRAAGRADPLPETLRAAIRSADHTFRDYGGYDGAAYFGPAGRVYDFTLESSLVAEEATAVHQFLVGVVRGHPDYTDLALVQEFEVEEMAPGPDGRMAAGLATRRCLVAYYEDRAGTRLWLSSLIGPTGPGGDPAPGPWEEPESVDRPDDTLPPVFAAAGLAAGPPP